MPGGETTWSIRTIAGMTHLENRDYWTTQGNSANGVSILMAHQVSGVVINCAYVREHNPSYFSGRDERNENRRKALADDAACEAMAEALNEAEAARAAFAAALAKVEALSAYDVGPVGPFNADRHDWDKIAHGNWEEKRTR